MSEKFTEVRFQMSVDDLAVIDGYCSGTGKDRTTVIREVLGEWSKEKLHVAMVTVRKFVEELGVHEVMKAMEIACSNPKINDSKHFKYFCGICWNKIKEV